MSWSKDELGRLREYQTAQMTVSEIAAKMQKKKSDVRRELVSMGYLPIEIKQKPESEFLSGKTVEIPKRTYTRITPETEKKICELREQCFTIGQIKDKLNLHDESTVRNVLKRNGYPTERGKYHKETKEDTAGQTGTEEDKPMKAAQINEDFDKAVNEMIAEAKEKEPASVGADTSSEVRNSPNISTSNDTTETRKSQVLSGVAALNMMQTMISDWTGMAASIVSLFADKDVAELTFMFEGTEYLCQFGPKGVPEYGNDKH